jgi:hypothetical protein
MARKQHKTYLINSNNTRFNITITITIIKWEKTRLQLRRHL